MPARSAMSTRAPWFVGALVGLAWAVLARAWMAFITESPEFTLAGTGFILGGGLLVGLLLGVVEGRRRAGGRRWWKLVALLGLPYFMGPGILLLPALLFGGVALSGRGPRWARALAAAATLPGGAALVSFEGGVGDLPRTPWLALCWFVGLCVVLAVGGSTLFRSWPQDHPARKEPMLGLEVPSRELA